MKTSYVRYLNVPKGLAALVIMSLTSLGSVSVAEQSMTHTEAYRQSLIRLLSGHAGVLEQMHRIHSGEVAHFDFLQYEHIEVIRHARALGYPPSIPDTEQRNALIVQADRLLDAATNLEWPIADFLRGHAMLHSALSNTIDIARLASADSEESTEAVVQNLLKTAQEFQASFNSVDFFLLTAALDDVISDTRLTTLQWHKELMVQKNLLTRGMESSSAALAAAETSSLSSEARILANLYQQSRQRQTGDSPITKAVSGAHR